MKQILKKSWLTIACLLYGFGVYAYDFEVDGICYNVTSDTDNTVEVTSQGNYAGEVVIPESVVYDDVTYNVTSIGDKAFAGSYLLTSVAIPESVTSIGNNAFTGCCFLVTLTIPQSITTIGENILSDCYHVESIVCHATIPPAIHSSTFANTLYNPLYVPVGYEEVYKSATHWTQFTQIIGYVPGINKLQIGTKFESNNIHYRVIADNEVAVSFQGEYYDSVDNEYTGELVIPDSITFSDAVYRVTSIDEYTFMRCDISAITIPDSFTKIGNRAFMGSNSLTSITLSNNIISIGEDAFSNCISLTEITIPEGVTNIGAYAFIDCTGLQTFTLNAKNCTYMGNSQSPVFTGCTNLSTVSFGESVKVIPDYAFKGCSNITSVTIPESVTEIGLNAFSGCKISNIYVNDISTICNNDWEAGKESSINIYLKGELVTDVVIPENVTKIGNSAFKGCVALTSIKLPKSIASIGQKAFQGCTRLSSIIIPDGVTSIGNYAFQNCESLTSASIGNGVTTIGSYAFQHCTNLKEATIGNSVTTIGYNTFFECASLTEITIPNSVTSIGRSAFQSCTGLKKATIGDGVVSIGNMAFYNCTGLTTISIGNGVSLIGNNVFYNCENLTEVTIPESVTSIGNYAFSNCTGLKSLKIEAVNPPSIQAGTFDNVDKSIPVYVPAESVEAYQLADNWSEFTNIVCKFTIDDIHYKALPQSGQVAVTYYGVDAYNVPNEYKYTGSVVIPESVVYNDITYIVTSLDERAFADCSELTEVVIPESVISIGDWTFYNCTGLTEITIPNSVTSIGRSAFSECSGLKFITLGSCVNYIYSNAFFECPILEVECLATVPPTLESDQFSADVCVFVPSGCGATYRQAEYWKGYNIIDTNPANGVEVTVSQPGYLAVDIDNLGIALKNVTELKVHGEINLTDFSVMRNNMTSCYLIDLSDAKCNEIPNDAFSGKKCLKKIVLPTQTTAIGNNAFSGCVLLVDSIAFPEGLVSIGANAFKDCEMLAQEIVLPNSIQSVGSSAFAGCKKIKSVTLPESLSTIEYGTFTNCVRLSSVLLPKSLNSIESEAFLGCALLGNVSFPTTLIEIGCKAFGECANMTLVDLANCEKLTTIEANVFEACSKIETLNLPASLQSVGESAFANCTALANISIYATTPPVAGNNVFKNVDNYNCLLSYPTASHVEYLTSGYWGAFVEARKSIDVEVGDADCNDCQANNECNKHHHGGHIWYDRDWHKHHGGYHAPRRNSVAEEVIENNVSGIDASIGDGLSLFIPTDSVVTFLIEPEEGYDIGSVRYGGVDVTEQLNNGVFTTSAVNANTTLEVSFIGNGTPTIPIVPGDANDDAVVNVADVVVIVNYILGDESAVTSVENADANNDEVINVGDVVSIINMVLSESLQAAPSRNETAMGCVAINDLVIAQSETSVIDVMLDNVTPYTAFQIDVKLPSGLKANNIVLSKRLTSTHSVMWRMQDDNTLRVVVFTLNNTAIADNSGALFTIEVTADATFESGIIVANNAIFTACDLTTHYLSEVVADAINPTEVNGIYTTNSIYAIGGTIFIESICKQVAYITTTGGVMQTVELQAGRNEITISQPGAYIVAVGAKIQKVIIR